MSDVGGHERSSTLPRESLVYDFSLWIFEWSPFHRPKSKISSLNYPRIITSVPFNYCKSTSTCKLKNGTSNILEKVLWDCLLGGWERGERVVLTKIFKFSVWPRNSSGSCVRTRRKLKGQNRYSLFALSTGFED